MLVYIDDYRDDEELNDENNEPKEGYEYDCNYEEESYDIVEDSENYFD